MGPTGDAYDLLFPSAYDLIAPRGGSGSLIVTLSKYLRQAERGRSMVRLVLVYVASFGRRAVPWKRRVSERGPVTRTLHLGQ
jgi:hypothetical protein